MSDKPKEVSAEVANSILIEAKAKRKENRQLLLISTISVLVFLGIWELAVRVGWIDRQIFVCAHYSSKNHLYRNCPIRSLGWSRIGSSYYHEFEIGSGRVLQRSYRRRSTGNDYGILSYF